MLKPERVDGQTRDLHKYGQTESVNSEYNK